LPSMSLNTTFLIIFLKVNVLLWEKVILPDIFLVRLLQYNYL